MTVEPSTTEGAEQEPIATPDGAEATVPASADTSGTQDANTPAESSAADGTTTEGDKKPTSTLEAIEAAIEADKPAAESPPAEKGKQDQEDEADAEPSEDDEATDKDLPFHKHPRWQEMVSERDQYKAKVAEYEDSHQAINRLETFMTAQGLSVEDFNTLLQVGAHMRNDPQKALEAMAPYYNQLLEVTGSVLPADVRQAVEEGTISENYARELARARAQSALSQSQVVQAENRSSQQETNRRLETLSSTASAWEQKWSSTDPDYAKKAELVKQSLELRWRRGDVPSTEDAMRAQCEEEKKVVEKQLRSLLPKKPAINPGPDAGAAGSQTSATPPKSLMEAMQRAVGG